MSKTTYIVGAIVLIAVALILVFTLYKPTQSELPQINTYNFENDYLNFGASSPPAPSENCKIYGYITDAKFVEKQENECITENSCPTDTLLTIPEHYMLRVYVSNVESFGETPDAIVSCQDEFKIEESYTFYTYDISQSLKSDNEIMIEIYDSFIPHVIDNYSLQRNLY